MNGFGKLRRCTEMRQSVVDFYLVLAAALVVLRQLIERARHRYRWASRPPPDASSSPYCRSLLGRRASHDSEALRQIGALPRLWRRYHLVRGSGGATARGIWPVGDGVLRYKLAGAA
jgi:hypothetical protein